MAQKEMIPIFCRMGITDNMFWLGAVERTDKVNGMTYSGNCWIIYYREHGQLQHAILIRATVYACQSILQSTAGLEECTLLICQDNWCCEVIPLD